MKVLRTYLARHGDAMLLSYAQLRSTALASLITGAVIGIALALPASLMVLLQNIKLLSAGWSHHGTQISLFLDQKLSNDAIDNLLSNIKVRDAVASMNYISPQQGLHELEAAGGFSNILSQLPSNPLPPVIEVYPTNYTSNDELNALFKELQTLPGVVSAKLDLQWIQRLTGILNLMQHGLYAVIVLLAVAVILVISNTIWLVTQNRRKEIEVLQLIGATNGFIRRPFLYTGIIYGLSGGILAWLLATTLIVSLAAPVSRLAALYNSTFQLQALNSNYVVGLLLLSAVLGWFGSWLAVRRHFIAAA